MPLARWLSLVLLILVVPGLPAQQPADLSRVFFSIQRQLRDPAPSVRIAGLKELRRYPQTRAAQHCLLVTQDPDADVRQAALETLVHLQDDPKVRSWMTKTVYRDLSDSTGMLAIALLTGSEDGTDLIASLDKLFRAYSPRLVPLVLASDDLKGWSNPQAIRAVTRLSQLEAFGRTIGLQRAVIDTLIGRRESEAVSLLIDLTEKTDGEVRFQITDHLCRITGHEAGLTPAGWQEWWQANQKTFRYPDKLVEVERRREDDAPSYYGLPIRAKRLVFVIDISGSMVGQRIANAKKELLDALTKLPASTVFNIVVYSNRIGVWSPRPVPASDDAKRRAAFYVNSLGVGGATFTYDALQATLKLKVEAIYLLTDGQPTGGQIVAPDAIRTAIRKQNALQGSSIHTIGIATGPDESVFSRFLQSLAEQNYGQFRKVEQ